METAILAGLYVLVAKLGLELHALFGFASLVWPASGLALAALLMFGLRLWPGIALGALIANLWAGAPAGVAIGIATGNTLEALLGAYALRRIPGFTTALDRLTSVAGLILLAAVLSTMVSATIGVTSLFLGGIAPAASVFEIWRTWWTGDAIGVLVAAPLLLVWASSRAASWKRRELLEGGALVASLLAIGILVYRPASNTNIAGLAILFFPLLIWATLRFAQQGAVVATFLISVMAIAGTTLGHGPFVRDGLHEALLALQIFMGIISVTFLVLGASVAERLGAVAVLQESEARKAGILEASLDCIVTIDERGNLIDFNSAAERTFGYLRKDVIGKEMASLIIPPGQRDAHRKGLARFLASGHGPLLGRRIEVMAMRADGTEFPSELAITPVHTGQATLFTGHIRDVTEKKRAAEETERRFRAMIEWMPQLAWWARPDGFIEYYNPRWYEYTGTKPAEMEGWGWTSVHDPAILPSVMERWKGSIATGDRFEMEFPIRSAAGTFRWFLTRVTPMRNDAGEIVRWIGINTDIHDQKAALELLGAARAEAESANRAKDEFMAMLGHELRNPLAPILTALQIMRLRDPAGAERERDVIERQVTHLVRLVDDLLDVSRITSGKVQIARDRLDLGGILAKAVETAGPLIEEHRHTLIADLPADLLVDGDAHRLQQVFSNLLTNAAKYTPAGGQITIRGAREGTTIVVHVKDTGVGIDPDLLPRVFELFVQGRQDLDRARGGLGLGLAIVRRLVELHGGSVSVASEGVGRGATFSVRLPAAAGSAPVAKPVVRTVASSAQRSNERVLIVDDNQDAAEMLSEALQSLGYQTRTAYDGPSALGILGPAFKPDVVILDIGLPVMDGYEVARRIRGRDDLGDVSLFAVTGYGQAKDRERAEESGFDAHLVKPVDINRLTSLIEAASQKP